MLWDLRLVVYKEKIQLDNSSGYDVVGSVVDQAQQFELEIVRLNFNAFIDLGRPLAELEDSQDEKYIDFIKRDITYHRYSLGFYDKKNNVLAGQICGRTSFNCREGSIWQGIFLITHPLYQNRSLSKLFRLISLQHTLAENAQIEKILYITKYSARLRVGSYLYEMDPELKKYNFIFFLL